MFSAGVAGASSARGGRKIERNNYFIGRNDPKHMLGRTGNFWAQFGSAAIDGPKYPAKQYWDRRPVSIDYYNNYMTNFHDDAFEIDGSMHNVRVMRNMMINNASRPSCNQPALGGPVYWIRNISFNSPGGSIRLGGGSGILFYNNTILGEASGGTLRIRTFETI